MAQGPTDLEISRLYLDLANECFSKAAIEEHAGGAEIFRRMGLRYVSEAATFNPGAARASIHIAVNAESVGAVGSPAEPQETWRKKV